MRPITRGRAAVLRPTGWRVRLLLGGGWFRLGLPRLHLRGALYVPVAASKPAWMPQARSIGTGAHPTPPGTPTGCSEVSGTVAENGVPTASIGTPDGGRSGYVSKPATGFWVARDSAPGSAEMRAHPALEPIAVGFARRTVHGGAGRCARACDIRARRDRVGEPAPAIGWNTALDGVAGGLRPRPAWCSGGGSAAGGIEGTRTSRATPEPNRRGRRGPGTTAMNVEGRSSASRDVCGAVLGRILRRRGRMLHELNWLIYE